MEGPDSSDDDVFVLEGKSFLTNVLEYRSVFSWRMMFVFKVVPARDQSWPLAV